MTKKTEKELKQRIAYLERERQVFRQSVQDSYKVLLNTLGFDDESTNKTKYVEVVDDIGCVLAGEGERYRVHGENDIYYYLSCHGAIDAVKKSQCVHVDSLI